MGPAEVGPVICFEVAFDNLVRDAVRAGGDLLAVQTNNATFGLTPMTEQQLAMSRIRAVEHGRTVLVSALAGVSAIIGPDGDIVSRAELYTQDALVGDVQLFDRRTPATSIGEWPELVLIIAGLGSVALALYRSRRRTGDATIPDAPDPVTVDAQRGSGP
jgi:apolipoprotein N-acyltransferase